MEEQRHRLVPIPVSKAEVDKLTQPAFYEVQKWHARGIDRLAEARGLARILEQVTERAQLIAVEEMARAERDGWPPVWDGDPNVSPPEGRSSISFHLDAQGLSLTQPGPAWLELRCTMPVDLGS